MRTGSLIVCVSVKRLCVSVLGGKPSIYLQSAESLHSARPWGSKSAERPPKSAESLPKLQSLQKI